MQIVHASRQNIDTTGVTIITSKNIKQQRTESFWLTIASVTTTVGIIAATTNMFAGYVVSPAAMWSGMVFLAIATAMGYTIGVEAQKTQRSDNTNNE